MPPVGKLSNSFAALDVSAGDAEPAARPAAPGKRAKPARARPAAAAQPAQLPTSAAEATAGGAVSLASVSATSAPSAPPAAPLPVLNEPLLWLDMEMTGLDPKTDSILEIAVLVSDGRLAIVREGPSLVVHQPESVLAGMNDWCMAQHGRSGLTGRVRASAVSLAEAEEAVLAFAVAHAGPAPGCTPLAGSSVHQDLAFLRVHMPRLAAHVHYRIVDVTSVRELARRWYPEVLKRAPRRASSHTALADIRDSLEELRWLRAHVFK